MRIKVVTDSSCDLPQALIEKYDIEVVPLDIILNGEKTAMTPDEIIKKIDEGQNVKSSQVTPLKFKEAYSLILKKYDGIISIHLSSKLSGTYNSAVLSAKDFGEKIEVVDSLSTSAALGALVLKAAELSSDGDDLKKISNKLREFPKSIETIFGIKVINNLVKGGRVGPIVGKLTNLFNAKPILRGIDGEIKLYKVTLGFKRVLKEITNFINTHNVLDERIILAHVHADEDVEYIKNHVSTKVLSCHAGQIITIHGGYGFVLVGFISADSNGFHKNMTFSE